MENVVLIIHLLLALGLIGVVLLQRNEGGGLGIGGGGGPAGQRAPVSPMAKVTWMLASAFIVTSITLTILAARNASGSSLLDRLGTTSRPAAEAPAVPGSNINVDDIIPPASGDGNTPLLPSAD